MTNRNETIEIELDERGSLKVTLPLALVFPPPKSFLSQSSRSSETAKRRFSFAKLKTEFYNEETEQFYRHYILKQNRTTLLAFLCVMVFAGSIVIGLYARFVVREGKKRKGGRVWAGEGWACLKLGPSPWADGPPLRFSARLLSCT